MKGSLRLSVRPGFWLSSLWKLPGLCDVGINLFISLSSGPHPQEELDQTRTVHGRTGLNINVIIVFMDLSF